MKRIITLLLLILIMITTMGIVSANENTTDDLLQTAPEKVEFIKTEIDIEDRNTPVILINTTDTTNEIIIESIGMNEGDDSKVNFNTDYKPQTLELTLNDLNINDLDKYWIFVYGKGDVVPKEVAYNQNKEWNIANSQLKITADKQFSIGKYSITLSDSEYSNLRNIKEIEKNNNLKKCKAGDYYEDTAYTVWRTYDMATDSYKNSLTYTVKKYTGKTVKQKIGVGYKWKTVKTYSTKQAANKAMQKLQKKDHKIYNVKKVKKNGKIKYQVNKRVYKKIVTKNAKVYISIDYGGFNSDLHKFTMRVNTKYQDDPGDTLVSGSVFKYKTTSDFLKLKS